uniref:Uncharacterized protein n=1 Tax=Arcella intermedia TaxID=1963864 RepID=A0A6B2LYV6_9EUKA
MTGVTSNTQVLRSPSMVSLLTGMLERAVRAFGKVMVREKRALQEGSSQQGNARRASQGAN